MAMLHLLYYHSVKPRRLTIEPDIDLFMEVHEKCQAPCYTAAIMTTLLEFAGICKICKKEETGLYISS